MKYLKRNTDKLKQYTPVKQHRKDGNLFVVPYGRPIQASCQKELEKKMKNRASALEARKRAKMKEEELEERLLQLETENEIQQTINRRLKALIEKFTPRSAAPKPVINHPVIDFPENNNIRTEIMPPVLNNQAEHQFEQSISFELIEDAPAPPPTKQQPLQNPSKEIPAQNALSEYFSNFQCSRDAPFLRQDSGDNSTTSSICSLPPSPDASPRLAKRKMNDHPPKSCLETCPIEDFEDSLEFLFSL